MIDPGTLVLTSNLASMFANLVKEFRDRGAKLTATQFQEWLTDTAVPALLHNSDQIFESVRALEATSADRFDEILARLQSIEGLLRPNGPRERWEQLTDAEKRLLDLSYETFVASQEPGSDRDVDLLDPSVRQVIGESDVKPASTGLKEAGLIDRPEAPRMLRARIKPAGVVLLWMVRDPYEAAERFRRVHAALPADSNVASVEGVSKVAGVSAAETYVVLAHWHDMQFLTLQDSGGQPELARVSRVTQAFRKQRW